MIDEEKRRLMNELYHAAVQFRKDQLEFFDSVSVASLKNLQESGQKLHDVLKRINGGKDPVHFVSSASSICATAAMLARTA